MNITGTYLIHFLALSGITPSKDKLSVTGRVPYKYSVGADEYVIIKLIFKIKIHLLYFKKHRYD